MILIIGGAYQGKSDFARSLVTAEDKIIYNAHEKIRQLMRDGKDAATEFNSMLQGIDVVTCAEIGMGIVPLDEFEREWRETTGRIMCRLAKEADMVYRIVCGIAIRIKG